MKVYVAGLDLNRAAKVMDLLKAHGHQITYDWVTDYNEENQAQKAFDEREGVRNADVLVYLWEDNQESARYEAGMAMGLGKSIIAVGHEAFFFLLPEVVSIESDEKIIEALASLPQLPS